MGQKARRPAADELFRGSQETHIPKFLPNPRKNAALFGRSAAFFQFSGRSFSQRRHTQPLGKAIWRVLLATGTVASRYCMDAPVDAAVVAIVDEGKQGTSE